MTNTSESPLAMAGRHVVEAEARVRRQAHILAELERDGHPDAAVMARTVLATLETTLDLMREHLRLFDSGFPRQQMRGTPTIAIQAR